MAQMVEEPRSPSRRDVVTWLQKRVVLAALPARHKSCMATMLGGQKRGDRRRLAVRLRRKQNSFVRPFHDSTLTRPKAFCDRLAAVE
jgi:hypothetical protein